MNFLVNKSLCTSGLIFSGYCHQTMLFGSARWPESRAAGINGPDGDNGKSDG